MGVFFADFRRGDFVNIDAKGPRHCGGAKNFLFAFVSQGNRDRSNPFKPRRDAGFSLQCPVELLRVFCQFGHIRAGAQLRDQSGGMPCGARGQLFAFEQHHIFPS